MRPNDADEPSKIVVIRTTFPEVRETANNLKISGFVVSTAIDAIQGREHRGVSINLIQLKGNPCKLAAIFLSLH